MGGAFGCILARLRREPAEAGGSVPDAELLARFARTRDDAAFELLLWRHAAMVYGVCRRGSGDEHRAEDAFQATFLVLARKAGSVRGSNVAGWLFRVARRVTLRMKRSADRGRAIPLAADPTARSECCVAERTELRTVLDDEVGRLPSRFRQPVLLCYLGGRTADEAARLLRIPRGTVLSRLAAARQRLAARLTRRGVTLPLSGAVVPAGLSAVVPSTVRAAVAFACRRQITGFVPAVIAEGVVTTMTIGKSLAAAVVVLVLGTLSAWGLVAGQAPAPDAPGGSPPAGKGQPAPPPPGLAAKHRDEEIRKLEQLADRLAAEINHREQEVQKLHEMHDREELRAKAVRLERDFQMERDLAMQDVRESAVVYREARRVFEGAEHAEAAEKAAKRMKVAESALKRAKSELRKLDDEYEQRTADLRARMAVVERGARQAETLLRELVPQREQLQRVRIHVLELRTLGQVGLLPPNPSGGTDPRIDHLLQDVRELRREVRELKQR
jgi:RNA polymerase sigma factor (sigma-70 family)